MKLTPSLLEAIQITRDTFGRFYDSPFDILKIAILSKRDFEL